MTKTKSQKLRAKAIKGSGAYSIGKAAKGKNAAAKRSKILNRIVDIGGRSLGPLKQAAAGDYMGALMSGLKILGQGDYKLARNTVVEDMTREQVPAMHSSRESIRFKHREFICDVYSGSSTTNFNSITYSINPGLQGTFPFLSPIAQQFQEYRFHGLAFEYKPTSAVAIASATQIAMGTVMMAAQYRSTAPAFTSKQVLLNEMWAVDGRPSDEFMLPIECDPQQSPNATFYVRGTGLASGDDIKFFDLCKLTVANQGIPIANQVIGELWVTYDVELLKPLPTETLDLYGYAYQIGLTGTYNPGVGGGGSLMFGSSNAGTAVLAPIVDNIGFSTTLVTPQNIVANTGTGYIYQGATNSGTYGNAGVVFPLGVTGIFCLSWVWTGTSTATAWVNPSVTNCTLLQSKTTASVTTTTVFGQFFINISNPSTQAVLYWTSSNSVTLPTNPTAASTFTIMPLPGNLASTLL